MIPRQARRLILLLIAGATLSSEAAARWDYRLGVEGAWRTVSEREAGAELVGEEGVLAGLSGAASVHAGGWRLGLDGGLLGGSLDYDGATQLGVALNTRTEWQEWHVGTGVEHRFARLAGVAVGGGVEYESRQRDILSTEAVQGLGERYRTVWLHLRGALHPTGSTALEAGVGCAIASDVDVRLEGFDDASLSLDDHCRVDVSARLDVGRIGSKALYVRPFVSWERYGRSAAASLTADGVGVGSIYLPRTEFTGYGVTIGLRVRSD
ncbi:MAG: hypothetical protein P8Y69_01115 [Gammaproteobacteria bacterium]